MIEVTFHLWNPFDTFKVNIKRKKNFYLEIDICKIIAFINAMSWKE